MEDEEWDRYEQLYGDDEPERARRTPRSARAILTEFAEPETADNGLQTTYKPSRFEAGWLLESLQSFFQQSLITDVLAHVKGGKEASVYCCKAHERTGETLLAAKVYRPRQFRNLRNDKMYREGRPVLTGDGRPVKPTDTRLMRALGKKTDFGVQVEHTSWLMYEYTTLESLFAAGAAVPKPVAASDNAILMGYRGDALTPAPTLSQIRLEPDEAPALFEEAMRNIALLLELGFVHGDLSAYNILYWEGAVTLIDFPQVTSLEANPHARFILDRDVTRVCEYFAAQGAACDPSVQSARLWKRYAPVEVVGP